MADYRQLLHRQGDDYALETVQWVEPLLEQNRALASGDSSDGYSPSREWRRIATIPTVVQLQWKQRYGVEVWNRDHWPAVKRLLNDPDWRWLRTSTGRV
ncbi:MAG: hypothetical protein ORO03_03475 [Alphaproteobacteria bacterium]|nr:hypothetical protein [Alphaproteobacteria bacterium]